MTTKFNHFLDSLKFTKNLLKMVKKLKLIGKADFLLTSFLAIITQTV